MTKNQIFDNLDTWKCSGSYVLMLKPNPERPGIERDIYSPLLKGGPENSPGREAWLYESRELYGPTINLLWQPTYVDQIARMQAQPMTPHETATLFEEPEMDDCPDVD